MGTAWAQCSIVTQGCKKGEQPDPAIYLLLTINTAAVGLLVALIFGTTKETVFFWMTRFNNLRHGKSFFAGLTLTTSKAGSMVNTADTSTHVNLAPALVTTDFYLLVIYVVFLSEFL